MANDILAKMAVVIGAQTAEFNKKINETDKRLNVFTKQIKNISSTIKAAFAFDVIRRIGGDIIEVTSKFQKFEAVLTNTLGSKSRAQSALKDIEKFAAKTPFGVDELTASFVKLANQGFEPTIDQLRQLGDLAASQGKSFDQLTEAIIDAQTGEFERLKEFGIRASKQGNQVSFTFKGVKQQVDFTNESIRAYILSLGDLEGVTGGMDAISKTLGGSLSNLQDSFDKLFNEIGKGSAGPLQFFIDKITIAINTLSDFIRSGQGDPFLEHFMENVNKEVDQFKKLTKPQQETAINQVVEQVQEAQRRLADFNKFIETVNSNTAKRGKERAIDLARQEFDFKLSMQDAIKLFDDQDSEIKSLTASVTALWEQYKQYTKVLDDVKNAEEERRKASLAVKNASKFNGAQFDTGNVNFPGEFKPEDQWFTEFDQAQMDSLIQQTEAVLGLGEAYGSLSFNVAQYAIDQEMAAEKASAAADELLALSSIGENFAESLASGQQSAVQALGNATLDIVSLYQKQALAAAIANAIGSKEAKIGGPIVGIALAGVAIAAVRSLFNKNVGGAGGGGGSAGVSAQPQNIKSFSRNDQIELGGTIEINGEKLLIVLKNAESKQGVRRG